MKCHVDMSEIVFHVIVGMFLGGACAGVGIALGLDRYFLALASAVVGAIPLTILLIWYERLMYRATDETRGEGPWGRCAPTKAADDPLGD